MTKQPPAPYNLMMLSGDTSVAQGIEGTYSQMLARFSQYWQRIDILTPTAPYARARTLHGNVFVHPAPYHRVRQPLFIMRKGAALLQERPYHLITSHDFGFFYNGLGAYGLARKQRVPVVSEIHHVEGYPRVVSVRERLWRAAARLYIPFAARYVAGFRTVNQEVSQLLKAWGVASDKIYKLHSLYLDLDTFKPMAATKRYDVLFIGRFATNKGIMTLLEAIAIVKQQHPQATLALRGDGPLRATIEHMIAESDLAANVSLLPRLPNTEALAQLYNQARMLVCASTVEGNPRVTVEAMACGVPVITTPVGIMPELIVNGDNGLLFQWDAAELAKYIQFLLDNPARAAQLGDNGRGVVQRFAAQTMIEQYAQAYHKLIAQPNL